MNIKISDDVRRLFPDLKVGIVTCEGVNNTTTDALWQEMESACDKIKNTFPLEDLNKRLPIFATRQAYKKLGKDPNRYRPSAEALCRRIIRGIPIYRLSTFVDIINIVSITSGFSIGGFDANSIIGDIELAPGTHADVFEAIGRGLLNVEGLPLYRDEKGGIGTPTSDNERTKITPETTQLLLIFNAYNGHDGLNNAIEYACTLLSKYAGGHNFNIKFI